jgi:hypothetical protein
MGKNKGLFFQLRITLIAAPALLALAGCSSILPSGTEQQFQGSILKEKKPVVGARVRLFDQRADNCEAKSVLETTTDKRGHFQLSRATRSDDSPRPYALCVRTDDTWETLWNDTRGPTPHSVEFECDLADKFKDRCWVSWDKEGFKRGTWSR